MFTGYKITLIGLVLGTVCAAQSLPDAPRPQKIFDWQFVAVHTVAGASTVFDGYVTARGLGRSCQFVEGNQDLGPHPSAKSIAVHDSIEFAAVVAGDALLKYFGRHQGLPRWANNTFSSVGAAISTGKHVRGGYKWLETGCL